MTKTLIGLFLVLSVAPAYAQAPLLPGQQIGIDVANPGQMRSGNTTVLRPHANVVFQYAIDGGAPIDAVKAAPCTSITPAPAITCTLAAPALTPGPHQVEIRALVSPGESGVSPSAYTPPLAVAMIMVTGPSTPSNPRVLTPPQP